MKSLTRRIGLMMTGLIASALITGSAFAGDAPNRLTGVVELFTSQGCSSCPPADAALENYIKRDDVLALAYHVPYWDYLGWKDTLASPANEERQRGYAKTFKARSVYTPQAVINGRDHVVGSRSDDINAKLVGDTAKGHGLTVPIVLENKAARIHLRIDHSIEKPTQDVKLILVYFNDATTVDIGRGENTGRTITYRNTVTETQVLGMWDGQAMDIELPYSEVTSKKANGCAVLLQAVAADGSPGAILGAAILPRRSL